MGGNGKAKISQTGMGKKPTGWGWGETLRKATGTIGNGSEVKFLGWEWGEKPIPVSLSIRAYFSIKFQDHKSDKTGNNEHIEFYRKL